MRPDYVYQAGEYNMPPKRSNTARVGTFLEGRKLPYRRSRSETSLRLRRSRVRWSYYSLLCKEPPNQAELVRQGSPL